MKKAFCVIGIFVLFTLCVHIGRALADVAANARIVNQAQLTFDDGTGPQTVNASVTVTVAHVPGIPTLDSPADGTIAYAGADTPLDVTYTITASGNGPDTYTINSSVANQDNTGGAAATVPGTIDLGATITVSGSSDTVLQVPSDGNSDGAVNGLQGDDFVLINGQVRQVREVDDQASGTSTITLWTSLSAAPSAGVSVLEQQTFTLTVTSGTIVSTGADIVVDVDTAASSAAGATAADAVTATYTSGSATLTKYVRNVDNANGTTGATSFTVDSDINVYYTGGVTGAPGDTLEYLLLAENPGSGDLTDCAIADVLPTEFVTLVAGAYNGTFEIIFSDNTGSETELTQESDADAATVSGVDLAVQLGTVPANGSVFIVYQVTIN